MDKILVIDDSLLQAEVLKTLLSEDYEVTVCGTAKEGLSKAKTGSYSLIPLDVVMPYMDGFVLLKELQEDIGTKFIPVILITSLSDMMHEQKGLIMGAVDYITKPFKPLIVKARVNTHIKLFQYRKQFMKDAMIDELTGIPNRRSYENVSASRWREAVRLGHSFTVCMIDIDKFKMYNDTFGHPAGDKVIASVAKTPSAYEFMKKIRTSIEMLHIPHCSGISEWVTVSIGGATIVPRESDSYKDLLKKADDMLYIAKQQGRNRVIWNNETGQQWQEKRERQD